MIDVFSTRKERKMTNTKLLREIIADKGLKLTYIAKELGISRFSLSKKIKNDNEFLPSEINKLCKILGITNSKMKVKIFLEESSQEGNEQT